MPYFTYGAKEVDYLKEKDTALGAVIDEIGMVEREVMPDLFTALVNQIISQQISTKAAITVWNRLLDTLGEITPTTVAAADAAVIQRCGTSMRKATYISELAQAVLKGSLNLNELHDLSDDEVCKKLSSIRGIGVWTAEMLMIFSMQRPNVMSWDDLAIQRGLRMLYRHRKITKELFEKYRKRYAPYASVACLYLWEIAGGACQELTDPAPLTQAQKKIRAKARKKSTATLQVNPNDK